MSKEELREQLERLASEAPVASVPSDTFTRGRRSVARARAAGAVVGAACLVLAIVVGTQLVGGQPRAVDPAISPSSGDPAPGVPDHIWAPPHSIPATDGFALGRAAAAYVDKRGQVIVVDATTGIYRRVDLPTSTAVGATGLAALAPDGLHLAVVRTMAASGQPGNFRSDIAIVSLETGAVHYVLPDGAPLNISSLAWSSNGRWLAWHGVEVHTWSEREYRAGQGFATGTVQVAGRAGWQVQQMTAPGPNADVISVGDRTYSGGQSRCLAVSNDGHIAIAAGNTLWVDGKSRRIPLRAGDAGTDTVSAIWFAGDDVQGAIYYGRGSSARIGPLLRPTSQSSIALPVPLYLGMTPRGRIMLQHDDSFSSYDDPTTVVTVVNRGGVDLGTRPAIAVEPDVTHLTVATDLLGPTGETVQRPVPDWPMSTPQKLTVASGIVAAALLLGGGLVWWRRRRP